MSQSRENALGDLRRIALIVWEDSVAVNPTWQFLDEMETPAPALCKSVGWVMSQDEEQITLAVSVGSNGERVQMSGVITIPVRAIVHMEKFKCDPNEAPE